MGDTFVGPYNTIAGKFDRKDKTIEIITTFLLQGGVICLPNGRHTNKYRCIAIINKTKIDVRIVT
jgi:hypothetical protein